MTTPLRRPLRSERESQLSEFGSEFNIGISQTMGYPGSLSPTDTAVDYVAAVPEPASFIGMGLALLACVSRRRK